MNPVPHPTVTTPAIGSRSQIESTRAIATRRAEVVVAVLALVALLVAQFLIARSIPGTNYNGVDGKMMQGLAVAAFQFGGIPDLTNLNPFQGAGSLMLPKNVWANPAFWPFAFLDAQAATELSALIALACFTGACYFMGRLFGLSVVTAAVGAQLCIVLFAPLVLTVNGTSNFSLTPADAVVYAPHLLALGLLSRVELQSARSFELATAGIAALLLYSLCCDPFFSVLSGVNWAAAFVIVMLAPMRARAVLLRFGVLACAIGVLYLLGALEYLYGLTRSTARVLFTEAYMRPQVPEYVSAIFRDPSILSRSMKYAYLALLPGWALGLLFLRGRPRTLVAAATGSFGFYVAYSIGYALSTSNWLGPLPVYMEHSLFPLFIIASLAGYESAFRALAPWGWSKLGPMGRRLRDLGQSVAISRLVPLLLIAVVPAVVVFKVGLQRPHPWAQFWGEPWLKQPEIDGFLKGNIGLVAGGPFRGSALLPTLDYDGALALASLWRNFVPTANEYGQGVTAQSVYFAHKLWKRRIATDLNRLTPWPGSDSTHLKGALEMMGVRYIAIQSPHDTIFGPASAVLPRRGATASGDWHIHEIKPNLGDFSPTEVVTSISGAETMLRIGAPAFDFRKNVVLMQPVGTLVPARDMKLSVKRGGWHVSGRSDGTSLVVLPQQYSHCLQAGDPDVRIVRANLMLAGVVFSGKLDTDITLQYGVFSPGCALEDHAEISRLGLQVSDPEVDALRLKSNTIRPLILARLRAWKLTD
jgi:hypothetical protein